MKLAIGIMSGTSIDGIDIALAKISGIDNNTKIKFLDGITVPWEINTKRKIIDSMDLKKYECHLTSI